MMAVRYPILLTACAAVCAGGLAAWLNRAEPEVAIPSVTNAPAVALTTSKNHVTPIVSEAPSASLLTELESTSRHDVDVPHSLTLDAQGHLVPDEGLRTLMDFFLALDGEKEPEQIRALFLAAAANQCDAPCVAEAASMFDRYQHYLQTMQSQQSTLLETDDLRARLEAVTSLRHQLLGQELASGLFGYEETYDAYRVSQWEILNDKNLSPEEQQQQLDILSASAPAGLRQREQNNRQLQQARLLQQQFTSGSDELYAARIELVGQQAAERLQQLDQQRAQWDQRYQQYRQEVAALQQSGNSEQDQAHQLAQLRERHFSGQERLRVAALDRINGGAQQ